ncbi:hypothetical protein ACC739_38175, partial [Rhizobium ruizarguesonis]
LIDIGVHEFDRPADMPGLDQGGPILQEMRQPEGQLIGNLTETIILGMREDGTLLQSPIAMAHMTQELADLVVRLVPH